MARRNPLEKVNDRIVERYKRNIESTKNFKAVPFGEEEVSPKEFRSKFAEMSEANRQRVLDANGQAEILRQLKGG